MNKRRKHRTIAKKPSEPQPRLRLEVERLEDRNLMDAGGTAPLAEVMQIEAAPEAHVAVVPNDTSYGSQWALNNTGKNGGKADADIDGPEAWDITVGSLSTVVAVVDTGIDYRHQDLHKNIWINQGEIPAAVKARLIDTDSDGLITFWDLNDSRNQGDGKIRDLNGNQRIDGGDLLKAASQGGWANGASDDGDGYVDDIVGWDFLNNDNDPFDDNGHGTHVAGTIGAIGDNGVGVVGVNWKVQMMGLKFLGANGTGSVSGAVAALDYAVRKGAFASNHSWAMGNTYWQPLYDAVAGARQAGHIFIAAAGNGGSDGRSDDNDITPTYPSSFGLDNVIAVAATSSNDGLAAFSNYGRTTVDLGAPGLGIYSTAPNDRYVSMSGTSMATPHVTGVAALVKSQHPDWTASQIIQQVLSTTDPIAALNGRSVTGGRLNASKAVGVGQRDVSGPRVVALTPNGSGSDPVSSIRVSFSEAIDLASFTADDVTLTGPNGAISLRGIQAVAGSGDRQFDLLLYKQSTPGVYTVRLGTDIRDRNGNRMDQDRDGVLGEANQDGYSAQFTINQGFTYNLPRAANINDGQTNRYAISVDQDIRIADIRVGLVVSHGRLSDLSIRLRGPDGTEVMLTNQGATGTSFNWTAFLDSATKTLSQSASPYRDGFRPEGKLSSYAGKNARGTWELIIEDRVAGQSGRLYQFRLVVEQSPSLGASSVTEVEPAGGAVSSSTTEFQSTALDIGVSASLRLESGLAAESGSLPTPVSVTTVGFAPEDQVSGEDNEPERLTGATLVPDDVSQGDSSELFQDPFSAEQLMNYFASQGRR